MTSESSKDCLATTEDKDAPQIVGRFAPSPTGRLHAGNIFSYLMAWLISKSQNGKIVLRIEDLDEMRSKQHFADNLMRDLEKLGLTWDEGPLYQSSRHLAYEEAFNILDRSELVYPCFCTRAELHVSSAPHKGDTSIYSRRCAELDESERENRLLRGDKHSNRLSVPDKSLSFDDLVQGKQSYNLEADCGDFIIKRSDGGFAYQLAVVIDDAFQNVNNVVRGADLLSSTPQQMFIQDLLGYERPSYAHVPLIVDESGRRLSKRNSDASLDAMLVAYRSPKGVIGHIAYLAGLTGKDEETNPEELLKEFDAHKLKELFNEKSSITWK